MIIQVTQVHIDEGVPLMCSECPVALALLAHFDSVSIDGGMISATKINQHVLQKQPAIVKRFIGNFDNRRPVEPFYFEVEA